jgi:hypothetical protein
LGLTFAPTVPHLVHDIRSPSDGTVRSPGRWSTFMIFSWWQLMHQMSSDHTPLARMFAKSIGWIGSLRRFVATRLLLDDLVGGGQQRFWDGEAERLGGFHVDGASAVAR